VIFIAFLNSGGLFSGSLLDETFVM